MLLQIFYDIDTDGDGRYMLSFSKSVPDLSEIFQEPELTKIEDELESLTFSREDWLIKQMRVMTPLLELLTSQLRQQWGKIFKHHPEIVPVICFDKVGTGINPQDLHENVVMFNPIPLNAIPIWEQAFSSMPKIYFTATDPWICTTDHRIARKALKKYAYKIHERRRQDEKYDTISRMNHWYKEDTNHLIEIAKGCIHEFVLAKKYSKRIEEFLIVPAFHIGRMKKAQRLLLEKYTPQFLMSLPMVADDKSYTILFPAWYGKEENVYSSSDSGDEWD